MPQVTRLAAASPAAPSRTTASLKSFGAPPDSVSPHVTAPGQMHMPTHIMKAGRTYHKSVDTVTSSTYRVARGEWPSRLVRPTLRSGPLNAAPCELWFDVTACGSATTTAMVYYYSATWSDVAYRLLRTRISTRTLITLDLEICLRKACLVRHGLAARRRWASCSQLVSC